MSRPHSRLSTILVVDDEKTIRTVIETRLKFQGYDVVLAKNGREALDLIKTVTVDLVVLDIVMPGINGLQVCQEIRKDSDIPIIILSSLAQIEDRLKGLAVGADDYMVKPFAPKELVSRVGAILRRTKPTGSQISNDTGVLSFEHLSIDTNKRRVYIRGQSIKLTEIEFSILELMAIQPHTVVTREQFLQKAWGYIPERKADRRVIDVHISRIRETFNQYFQSHGYIQTVRGRGYCFLEPTNNPRNS